LLSFHDLPTFSPIAAFNLIEGIDVSAIEEKIAKYQEENAEQIMINRARKVHLRIDFSFIVSFIHALYTSEYYVESRVFFLITRRVQLKCVMQVQVSSHFLICFYADIN